MTDQKNVINEKYEKKQTQRQRKRIEQKVMSANTPHSHLLVAHIPIPKGKNIMPGKEEEK
mgnify:CR=1 FL=1